MDNKKFYFPIGFLLICIGLISIQPPPIVFAGITETPTMPATDTPIPTVTNTPVPTAVNTPVPTPIPTNTRSAVSTPNAQNTPVAENTPIPTPNAIPDLGVGPSSQFVWFGFVSFLIGGIFLFRGWLHLYQEQK